MIRSVAFLLLGVAALWAADKLSVFGHQWTVPNAADWVVKDGALQLIVPIEPPKDKPRRPLQFALADTTPFRKVTIELELRQRKRSVMLVYAWQDESHYNYAHISSDAAAKAAVHNGMFHVFGGERVRISPLDGPESLSNQDWTPVKLVFDGDTGRCYVEVNGKRNPSLEAVDMSLRWGRVGLGSFNEVGDFRNVRITGEPRTGGVIGQK